MICIKICMNGVDHGCLGPASTGHTLHCVYMGEPGTAVALFVACSEFLAAPPSRDESPGLLALFCGRKSPKSPKASPRKFSQTGQGMVVSEPSGDRATG